MHNFAQTFVKLCKTAQTTRQMQKFAIIENEKRCSFYYSVVLVLSILAIFIRKSYSKVY